MKPVSDPQKFDYRSRLTNLLSSCSVAGVARIKDIVSGLGQQTGRKAGELTKDMEELNTLRDGYQRYRELSAQIEAKERSVKIGLALLSNAPTNSSYITTERIKELRESTGIALEAEDLDLSRFSLWRVIREIVRQTTEIRVFELEGHLRSFGLKVSRPAIESALATHAKEFKTVKRGREKFVSLKGA